MTVQEFILAQLQKEMVETGVKSLKELLESATIKELANQLDFKRGTVTYTITFNMVESADMK
jgi:hypothetical protein